MHKSDPEKSALPVVLWRINVPPGAVARAAAPERRGGQEWGSRTGLLRTGHTLGRPSPEVLGLGT